MTRGSAALRSVAGRSLAAGVLGGALLVALTPGCNDSPVGVVPYFVDGLWVGGTVSSASTAESWRLRMVDSDGSVAGHGSREVMAPVAAAPESVTVTGGRVDLTVHMVFTTAAATRVFDGTLVNCDTLVGILSPAQRGTGSRGDTLRLLRLGS